jgi:hypothetical protein
LNELNYAITIHISNHKPISKCDFAILVVTCINFSDSLITKDLSSQRSQKAIRPQNLARGNGRLTEILGNSIPNLEDMMNSIVVDKFSQIEKLSPEGFKNVILKEVSQFSSRGGHRILRKVFCIATSKRR